MYTKFEDYVSSLNEAKFSGKRKYADKPAITMSTGAPIRNKVLEFINSKGKVSKTELMEFFNQIGESTGKRPSNGWLNTNKLLLKKSVSESGDTNYSLSYRGRRVLELTKKLMESSINENEESEKYTDAELAEFRVELEEIESELEIDEIDDIDESEDAPNATLLTEKGVKPKIEINTQKAEDACFNNKYVGDLHADYADIVLIFGEPAIAEPTNCEWYLYDRASKVSYMIKNKEGSRYKNAKGVPFEIFCNVSKGFKAAQYIQSIIDIEQEWTKVGENNEYQERGTDPMNLLTEKGVKPKIEINTQKAEDACFNNKYVGDLHADYADIVLIFGEPAVAEPTNCEWYLYDRASKVSYMIKNKEGSRYKNAKGVPFEIFCNVSKGFKGAQYIQSIIDVEQEWTKVGENNEEIFVAKKSVNE